MSFKSHSTHVHAVGFCAFREWLWSTRLSNVSACDGRRMMMQLRGCCGLRGGQGGVR